MSKILFDSQTVDILVFEDVAAYTFLQIHLSKLIKDVVLHFLKYAKMTMNLDYSLSETLIFQTYIGLTSLSVDPSFSIYGVLEKNLSRHRGENYFIARFRKLISELTSMNYHETCTRTLWRWHSSYIDSLYINSNKFLFTKLNYTKLFSNGHCLIVWLFAWKPNGLYTVSSQRTEK